MVVMVSFNDEKVWQVNVVLILAAVQVCVKQVCFALYVIPPSFERLVKYGDCLMKN